MPDPTQRKPLLSVIMPAHQAAGMLRDTLAALTQNSLPRAEWELIVVDDASSDGTSQVAAEWADRVITLPAPARGPGGARNEGSRVALGEWLMFVDADVRLHPDVLDRIVQASRTDARLVAIFGSYDASPDAHGLVTEYRNLLHRYTHCVGAGDAETFWAGCGAVRADAFRRVNGFDTARFPRPQIEDIELGYRLREDGGRILLDPSIQGTHLKRWTLGGMWRTDLFDRGIPWMELLMDRRGRQAGSLNTGRSEQVKVGLAAAGCVLLAGGIVTTDGRALAAGIVALTILVVSNRAVYRWFAEQRGTLFALAVIPLHTSYYVSNAVAATIGITRHLLRRPSAALTPA